jgi:hypothetical protein
MMAIQVQPAIAHERIQRPAAQQASAVGKIPRRSLADMSDGESRVNSCDRMMNCQPMANAANAAVARYVGAQWSRKSVWRLSPGRDAVRPIRMADARCAKMPDRRRYGMAAERHDCAAGMRHATGDAASEVRSSATAKMRHAAAADVNAAACGAPMGDLRLPGLWHEEK